MLVITTWLSGVRHLVSMCLVSQYSFLSQDVCSLFLKISSTSILPWEYLPWTLFNTRMNESHTIFRALKLPRSFVKGISIYLSHSDCCIKLHALESVWEGNIHSEGQEILTAVLPKLWTSCVLCLSFTQEDIWEIWGKVPTVLDLRNRLREAVSFTLWLF